MADQVSKCKRCKNACDPDKKHCQSCLERDRRRKAERKSQPPAKRAKSTSSSTPSSTAAVSVTPTVTRLHEALAINTQTQQQIRQTSTTTTDVTPLGHQHTTHHESVEVLTIVQQNIQITRNEVQQRLEFRRNQFKDLVLASNMAEIIKRKRQQELKEEGIAKVVENAQIPLNDWCAMTDSARQSIEPPSLEMLPFDGWNIFVVEILQRAYHDQHIKQLMMDHYNQKLHGQYYNYPEAARIALERLSQWIAWAGTLTHVPTWQEFIQSLDESKLFVSTLPEDFYDDRISTVHFLQDRFPPHIARAYMIRYEAEQIDFYCFQGTYVDPQDMPSTPVTPDMETLSYDDQYYQRATNVINAYDRVAAPQNTADLLANQIEDRIMFAPDTLANCNIVIYDAKQSLEMTAERYRRRVSMVTHGTHVNPCRRYPDDDGKVLLLKCSVEIGPNTFRDVYLNATLLNAFHASQCRSVIDAYFQLPVIPTKDDYPDGFLRAQKMNDDCGTIIRSMQGVDVDKKQVALQQARNLLERYPRLCQQYLATDFGSKTFVDWVDSQQLDRLTHLVDEREAQEREAESMKDKKLDEKIRKNKAYLLDQMRKLKQRSAQ